ncbi:MAG: tRNA uridine-5-carboxymethylaminomethyl(34) synthesis GTPase MnmE [Planctomycetes bacterium]|nr:tRNA uridine-5-carboxymethylaminomethyl(34) synthesis GTPase MnmE [Planctomycetota bacterium]
MDDTIIAVSSPSGNSLKGIIRLSGSRAFSLVQRAINKRILWENIWRSLDVTLNINQSKIPATLFLMPAPRSYTREDVVEIHVPGSRILLEILVEYFTRKGARLARPGEFTQRAFLNGRLNLTQAKAVLDIIHASSEQEHRLAVNQLNQYAFRHIKEINQHLLELACQIELTLDFSDQGVEIIPPQQIKTSLKRIIADINKILQESSGRSAGADGISLVLCGRPNTGKSSLFNCLVKDRRNIVSPVPGTTHDYIEGTFSYRNTEFRIFDTAGIDRPTAETPLPMRQADIYLLVIDSSIGVTKQDQATLKRLNPSKTILVANKTDLFPKNSTFHIPHSAFYKCSARTGSGIIALKDSLVKKIKAAPPERASSRTLINLRRQETLVSCLKSLNQALTGVNNLTSYEFVALDLKDALERLNMALGDFAAGKHLAADDILNNIFSGFCIGK